MKPTEQLMKEHRLIEKILEVLGSLAEDAERGIGPDPERARDTLKFFREFADRCHHGKEEKHLFPRLGERGYGPTMGPVAVMLGEHEQGRAYLRAVGEALDDLGADGARQRFASAARGYVELLGAHIYKEDNILFRLADSVFTEEDQRAVEEGFEDVERREMGDGAHERFHALAETLLAR